MAGRPGWTPLLAALAALLGSVALPWLNAHVESGFTSAYLPGYCYLSYDGYSYCDSGSIAFGSTTTVEGPVPGTQLPIRVIAALVAWSAIACYCTARRELLLSTAALGVFGLFAGSAVLTSGRVVWIAALAAVLVLLHRRLGARSAGSAQPPALS